jgi:hypothetical protein
MSRNGSGTYSLPAGNPVVTGTTITTTWANTTLSDISSALTGSVAADGQTPMSGTLNMANNKVSAVLDPTSAQDAATKAYVDAVGFTVAPGTSGNLLTSNGTAWTSASPASSPIPSGTVMLFYQASAPTGWTQVTTLNDYGLRLVSGTGGTTAGTTAYSTVFTNQTPSFTGAIGTLASAATTLSTSQIPSHTHTFGISSASSSGFGAYTSIDTGGTIGRVPSGSDNDTGAQGGGTSHSHSLSGVPGGTVGAVTLNVRYANIIICSKN